MNASSFVLLESKDQVIGSTTSSALSPDESVVTEDLAVSLYNVFDQKILSSWNLNPTSKLKLTHPATYHPTAKTFIGVLGSKHLISWDTKFSESLDKTKKKTFKSAIVGIITEQLLKKGTLIILEDGEFVLCDELLQEIQINAEMKKGKVIWTNVNNMKEKSEKFIIETIFSVSNNGPYAYHVFTVKWNNEKLEITVEKSYPIPTPAEKSKIISVSSDTTGSKLQILWSNGTLDIWSTVGNTFSKRLSRDINGYNLGDKGFKTVQLVTLRESIVLLFGINANKSGYLLTGWNTTYGTLDGSHSITDLSEKSYPVLHATLSSGSNTYIVVSLSKAVIVCPVYTHHATLASALGSLAATGQYIKNSDEIDKPSLLRTLNLEDTILKERVDMDTNAWNVSPLIEIDKIPEINSLNAAEEQQIAKLIEKSTKPEFFAKAVASYLDSHSNGKEVSQHATKIILTYALRNKSWTALRKLLECGVVSRQLAPELFSKLIDENQSDLIISCLENVIDLRALDLLQAVRYCLRLISAGTIPSHGLGGSQVSVEKLFAEIVSYNISSMFMQTALKNLSVIEAAKLLEYLHSWLGIHTQSTVDPTSGVPELRDVTTWISLLVDSHFVKFLLNKDVQPILKGIQEIVDRHLIICEKLTGVDGCLKILKEHKQQVPQKRNDTNYGIEFLKLPF